MTYTSDQNIASASLLILHRHYDDNKRPLRTLVFEDFERIRTAKKKIAWQWYVRRHDSKTDYVVMRSEMLDGWMKKHRWNIRTRNLYSSILAKLTVWEQHGINSKDQQLLQELEPGAKLFLQFILVKQPLLL